MSRIEQRRFKRLDTNWVVRIRATRFTDTSIERMRDHIRNVSTGGVFIETTMPFEIGTHVELVFAIPQRTGQFTVKGVVRWSNAGRERNRPLGMGVEFLEVTSSTRAAIEDYIAEAGAKRILEPLVRTTVHRNLLRIHVRRVGEQFNLDVLAQFLGCSKRALQDAVRSFAKLGLITIQNDLVAFVAVKDRELADAIRNWNQATNPP